MEGDETKLVSRSEAAGLLKVCTKTLKRWIDRGDLKLDPYRMHAGGRTMFRYADVVAFIEAGKNRPSSRANQEPPKRKQLPENPNGNPGGESPIDPVDHRGSDGPEGGGLTTS